MNVYREIFADFKQGELAQFYRLMYPELMVYANRLLGADFAFLAEDCVQNAEAAQALGIAEVSYKKRKARMVELLRQELKDESYNQVITQQEIVVGFVSRLTVLDCRDDK